ncbi:MAG: hypothetical protein R3F47_07600 [Gammaproteobacteria bacterium]
MIFALRNRNHGVNIEQQNRLHPYYLIYMAQDGTTVIPHTDVKRLLDLVRLACRGNAEPLAEVCRAFNTATDDGRDMRAYSALLDDAIRAMIDLKTEKDIDSLFSGGRTSALTHTIAGLDDFELIAFLVVQATA